MRIVVSAAGGGGDFGLTLARARGNVAFVDHGTHLVATQANNLRPSGRADTWVDPPRQAAGAILTPMPAARPLGQC